MTTKEFSDQFDTLVSSYRRFRDFDKREPLDTIEFNEYEKSVFLTQAQEELVISIYNGRNPFGESFESTEEMRRYLSPLVKTKTYHQSDKVEAPHVVESSIIFNLPTDLMFITMELVGYEDDVLGCYNGRAVKVYPVTQDEYSVVKRNPFRGPTKYKVLRLDSGNNQVELISKYNIGSYLIKYLAKPEPIILENLHNGLTIETKTEEKTCQLNTALHKKILELAVQAALQSKAIKTDSN